MAASSDSALIIVDMRGPEVLLFETAPSADNHGGGKSKHKPDTSSIVNLRWTISAIGEGEFHKVHYQVDRY
jgi:hypothetical protein